MFDRQTVALLSRELGVSENLLHNWKKAKIDSSQVADKEILELNQKLRELEIERDILKTAAIIFGRGN